MNKKITILDYYKEKSKIPNYVEMYRSTSEKKLGKTFWHINVNYRRLLTFIDTFKKFLDYENIDRSQWDTSSNSNEELAKHWTVRMRQSKLFRFTGVKKNCTTIKL